jgi:hypothetical protein
MIMDIPMKAEVFCTDGLCGHTTCIIVNPITKKITHVVVKERRLPHIEHLVPEHLIIETTPESITLRCSEIELSVLDEFVGYRFVQADLLPRYQPVGTAVFWPYVAAKETTLVSTEERIPPDELAIHRGARVEASDGPVGQVDEFLIDPSDGKITHLILRRSPVDGRMYHPHLADRPFWSGYAI